MTRFLTGPWRPALLVVALLTILPGCGKGKLATVTGTVHYQGQPVTGGTFIFSPVGEGQPAAAEIHPDGTYTLGTNGAADGALIGRHRVSYTPPSPPMTEEQRTDRNYTAPPSPYLGLAPREMEIDVNPGKNAVDIELVPASSRKAA
jgi:hypothetical protein